MSTKKHRAHELPLLITWERPAKGSGLPVELRGRFSLLPTYRGFTAATYQKSESVGPRGAGIARNWAIPTGRSLA